MSTDYAIVAGIIVLALSIPSVFSAFSESRWPWMAIFMVSLGGGLMVYAYDQTSEGYTVEDIPRAFIEVFSDFVR
ncbi:MAG: hypothetical protein HUJ27_11865 [Rhodobacteraceae bacterium]|nr:hypothetical protein [Paracoccaceae bacterium]